MICDGYFRVWWSKWHSDLFWVGVTIERVCRGGRVLCLLPGLPMITQPVEYPLEMLLSEILHSKRVHPRYVRTFEWYFWK